MENFIKKHLYKILVIIIILISVLTWYIFQLRSANHILTKHIDEFITFTEKQISWNECLVKYRDLEICELLIQATPEQIKELDSMGLL